MFLVVLNSCRNSEKSEQKESIDLKETLINANRIFVESESDKINSFILRGGYTMDSTTTGLRYQIIQKKLGNRFPDKNDLVEVEFDMQLLDGTLLYARDSLGTRSFVLGNAGIISGIEEGVKLMQEGDRAIFIVPSHLAFGFTGDGIRVPPNATLIINLELKNIIKHK